MGFAIAVSLIIAVIVWVILAAEVMDMLTDNKHSWWCKVGSHSWAYTYNYNDDPSMPTFTCNQCGKIHVRI